MSHEPLDRSPTLGATIDALLKTPGRLLFEMQEGSGPRVAFNLGIVAVLSLALFGFIMSLFSGGAQLWAVPVKVAGGGIVAGLITLPSLYVFSCLNGMDMTLKKAAAILLAGLALVGLILTGLCPVAWVFTQSTGSVGFMGFLILSFWMISLLFGVILVFKGARAAGVGHAGYLLFWAIIFVTVTLQMSTSLRPLIGPSEETFLPQEKRFFLEHWITELGESSRG
ncbi:MAG: hypothetical protein AAGA96_10370 [Verrucomicrobiota bacterium]